MAADAPDHDTAAELGIESRRDAMALEAAEAEAAASEALLEHKKHCRADPPEMLGSPFCDTCVTLTAAWRAALRRSGQVSTYKPPEPPGRAIIGVEWLEPEEDGQVRALLTCDCGTATDLTVEVRGEVPGGREAAFTCGGCQASHWFTVTATS